MSTIELGCLQCDLFLRIPDLQGGQKANCPRCGFLISSRSPDGPTRSLAFAIAALVLLIASNAFPFLSLQASGLEKVMTLPGTAVDLYQQNYAAMAVLVLGAIVVIPGTMVLLVIALTGALFLGHSPSWLVPAGRTIFYLTPWAMVEVFIIGVVVSLIKIGAMATVVMGISFWSYVGFALCFTATFASLDRLYLWSEIERVQSA